MSVSRRERPAPLSAALVRTAPPVPPAAASVARVASDAGHTGSSATGLSEATGFEIFHDESGRASVAFAPPPDVASRVPITKEPMRISREVSFGGFPQIPTGGMPALPQIPQGGMPALPQIPQAPAMPSMPQMPQLPSLGGGGGGELATSSSSDGDPNDQLRRQIKLDREQLGNLVDDLP